MKTIVKQTFVLIFGLGLLQSHIIIAKKCNDLIILLDHDLAEKVDGKSKALATQFIDNLYEKAVPMIVSTNIVQNFCFWKKEYKADLENIQQEALKTKNISMAEKKVEQLLSQKKDLNTGKKEFWVMLGGAALSNNDWHCYIHKQANLTLLIPKNYIALRTSQTSSSLEKQLENCGIKTTDFDKINNISPESILNYIQTKKISSFLNIIDGFKSIFITKKPSDEIEDIPGWNFYLAGHGNAAQKKGALKEENLNITTQLDLLNTGLKDIEKARSMGIKIDDQQLNMILALAEPFKTQNNTISMLLQSAENLSDDMIIPQSGNIAGVNFSDFSRMMNFINNNIKTNYIHYATCFGGGYNQTFVNDELQKLNVNFIVAAEGTNETSIFAEGPTISINNQQITISPMKFTRYFGLLENFFGEPTKVIGMEAPQGWQKDPLAAIIGTLVPLSVIGTNQPFVRIPSAGVFTALNVDKKVKILTNSIVKAHESENRTIDASNPEISIIFVYPKYIQVPLKITKNQTIISPTPQTVDQLYKTTHIFEEIITDQPLRHTIFNFILKNSSYSRLTFIIKKLICAGKSPVENVIIQITGKLSKQEIISSINILYTINGITHFMLIPSVNLNTSEFINLWNKSTFTAITPEQVTAKAVQLLELELEKENLDELAQQPIILSDIVTQFEKVLIKILVFKNLGH